MYKASLQILQCLIFPSVVLLRPQRSLQALQILRIEKPPLSPNWTVSNGFKTNDYAAKVL